MTREEFEKLPQEDFVKLMTNLQQYPGWEAYRYLIEDTEVEPLREKLLMGKFESLEEVKAAQARLTLVENLIYSPEAEKIAAELNTEDDGK